MLWDRVKSFFTPHPTVSVQNILRRIDERQTTIDQTLKQSDDQLKEVEVEVRKREHESRLRLEALETAADPRGRFRRESK